MITVGCDTPLSIMVNIIFEILRKDKVLVLSTLKQHALKDCISTSPEMIAASFSKET